MSNTILTHQMIAREAAAMLVEEDNLIPNINTGYDNEFGSPVQGYKKGATISIGVPPVPVTWNGSTFVDNDVTEGKVNLTLSQQIGAGLKFTAVEKVLNLSQFKERFLRPALNSVRTQVQAYLQAQMAVGAGQMVGTSGTLTTSRKTYAQAGAALDRFLAPPDRRTILYSSDANVELQDNNASLFNPSKEISDEFDTGKVGRYSGFDFYTSQTLPLQIGSSDTAYVVNAAPTAGATAVAVKTGTGAIKKGTLITIAGVNAVHPITGLSIGALRQFVVTADYAGGAGNLSVYPAFVPTTASVIGTIDALPAANAPITILDTVASPGARQGLAFHKMAFAAAFAPLPVLASCEGYTATAGNVSVRVMTFGDGFNDLERTRVDVLLGSAVVRPDHICRITE